MLIENESEIRINYEDFYIAYNKTKNIWYARHEDEEMFDNDIIINKESLPIELFNKFELTSEEFYFLAELVTNSM